MYVYLILSNIGNKPLFQWRQYACQLLKACSAAQPRGCSARFVLAGGVTGIIFVIRKLLTHKHIGYLPRCLLHASNTT